MLDPKRLRAEPEHVATQLRRRGFQFDLPRFLELEGRRKSLQVETEQLQSRRNAGSKRIGQAKARGEDAAPILAEMEGLKNSLEQNATRLDALQADFNAFALDLPNVPQSDVPDGPDASGNVPYRHWGEARKFPFEPSDHASIGEGVGGLDFAAAARITGARFAVMHGPLARLHRALVQFMLDVHVKQNGYEEVYVPYIVSGDALRGTGQLPKFAEDLFRLEGESDWWLAPTAEVPVTNLLRDTVLEPEALPRKWACHTPCFRAEAGAAGQDTRGLIRQHQFEKVELVQAVAPERSVAALESLLSHAEVILKKLELPYRVVTLCTGDMGFAASKTYDIEVWLPSQRRYREISSCSNFEDFQARRMQARFRRKAGAKPELVHTLNGSGLAIGRTLVAIMENFQDAQGGFTIPYALHNYMGGTSRIEPAG